MFAAEFLDLKPQATYEPCGWKCRPPNGLAFEHGDLKSLSRSLPLPSPPVSLLPFPLPPPLAPFPPFSPLPPSPSLLPPSSSSLPLPSSSLPLPIDGISLSEQGF